MADVNARINVQINAAQAAKQLAQLQSQISAFNRAVAASNTAGAVASTAMAQSLMSAVGATKQFSTSVRAMDTDVQRLGQSFDKGTLSARQYFRYAGSQVPGLRKAFRGLGTEQAQMSRLAEDRVKRLQTRYIDLGKDIDGVRKVMALRPSNLAKGLDTQMAMAQQRTQLFNRALDMGATKMVNWGKNTQWAGRQLMVGFSVPLAIAAGAAAKFFMDLEKASIQFRRVYGDMSTSTQEVTRNLEAIQALGREYTKYGIAVKDVVDLGARVAATGAENKDLLAATEQTLRLATLGQMEYGRALDATISLQTAFAISSKDLANTIDFLNAVENQTVLTMEDMALAVPRVAPVIKGLGGDVQDLAVFMTALREGGVTAEQGANALKSGLASLINPTKAAQEMLRGLGININEIVQTNKGDLMGTVKAFGDALNSLGEFERQQALEQVFGKYQYARLGALFKNIANDSSQASRAMDLAGASAEELAGIAEKELGAISESVTFNFLQAIEELKVAIAPIGEMFLKAVTPIVNAVVSIADAFNNLPEPVKNVIGIIVGGFAGLGPVILMFIGLVGNAIGNTIKGIQKFGMFMRGFFSFIRGEGFSSFKYLTTAELDANAAAMSLEATTSRLTNKMLLQKEAAKLLSRALNEVATSAGIAGAAMGRAARTPVMIGMPVARPGIAGGPLRMATGGIVPGRGNGDTVPAMLTPGEAVITKEATARYGPVLAAMNAGTLPGFNDGIVPGSKSNLVFAHGNPNIIFTDAEKEGIKKDIIKNWRGKGQPRLANPANSIAYGLSNFGFMMPEKFNAGEMSGKDAARYFNDKKLAKETMRPIYRAIADQLGVDESVVRKDPVIKRDVKRFAKNIGTELARMGARNVGDEAFYRATSTAFSGTTFQNPESRKGIATSMLATTYVGKGPDFTGTSGERTGISRRAQVEALGKDPSQARESYREWNRQERKAKQRAKKAQQVQQTQDRVEERENKKTKKNKDAARKGKSKMAAQDAKDVKKEATEKAKSRRQIAQERLQAAKDGRGPSGKAMAMPTSDSRDMERFRRGAPSAMEIARNRALVAQQVAAAKTGGVAPTTPRLAIESAEGIERRENARTAKDNRAASKLDTEEVKKLRDERVKQRKDLEKVRAREAENVRRNQSTLDRMNAANDSLAKQRTASAVALQESDRAERSARANESRLSRDAKTATDQRPATGRRGAGALGAARNFLFPGGRGSLRNLGINPFSGAVQSTRALTADVVRQTRAAISGNMNAITSIVGDEFKELGRRVQDNAKAAAGGIQKGTTSLVTSIKDMPKKAGGAIMAAAGGIGGGIGGLFRRPDMFDEDGNYIGKGQSRIGRAFSSPKMAGIGGMGMMASMVPFMAQDEEGKFMGMNANMVGMGMMGGFGLLSMMPMLGGPVTAVVAGLAAAGVALYAWRNSVDNAARAAADFGANIGGAANALSNMATMMGKPTPSQQLAQVQMGLTQDQSEQAFGEFQAMIGSEAGQEFLNQLENANWSDRLKMLGDYVSAAIASGMMDKDTGILFAKTIAAGIQDPVIGNAVSNIIKEQDQGAKALLEIAERRLAAVQKSSSMEAMRSIMDLAAKREERIEATRKAAAGELSREDALEEALLSQLDRRAFLSTEQSSQVVGSAIQIIKDFAEVAALAELEYQSGTLTFEKFNDVVQQSENVQSRYSEYIREALFNAADRDAVAQALLSQTTKAFNLTEEQVKGLEDAASVDSDYFDRLRDSGVQLADGFDGATARAARLGDAMVALASGMNAADIQDFLQYTQENVDSQAARFYAENAGTAGAIERGALIGYAERGLMPGVVSEEDQQVIIDLILNYEGSEGDLQAFLAEIPAEKVIDVALSLKPLSVEQQSAYISSARKLSTAVSSELQGAIEQTAASQASGGTTKVFEPGAPGRPKVAPGPSTLRPIEFKDLDPEQAEEYTRIIENYADMINDAKASGAFENLETLVKILMEEEPEDIEYRLPLLTQYALDLKENVPDEIIKRLGINLENPEDLENFGIQATQLGALATVLEQIPDENVKNYAINMMIDENGKATDIMKFGQMVVKLEKNLKKLDTLDVKDTVKRKNVVLEIFSQTLNLQTGEFFNPEESRQVIDNIIEATGMTEAEFFALPADVISKTIAAAVSIDTQQLYAAAAAAQKVADGLRAADEDAMAGKWEAKAEGFRQAAAAGIQAQVALPAARSTGGDSGGGGGGGGGGSAEEDPFKAMMEDLETQKKLIGDFVKKGDEVKQGFATALRNAGTPEYLIAEIVAKGKEGIDLAKKLLADKKKKLQELMDLSLEVARMTMVEQNRAAVNNFRTQGNAQNALFGAGIDPSTAIDLASDPQQAAAIADSYKKVQDAQQKLNDAKGKSAKKKARKELEDAKKDWDQLTNSIKEATKAQTQFNIESGVKGQARVERKALGIQGGALTRLMTQGFTFEQAQGFAGDEMVAGAIVAAGRAADAAARRFAYLKKKQQELKEENKQGTPQWKRINKELREAREQADITSKKYKALIADLQALTAAQKANLVTNTIAEYKGLTGELGMQQNILQKLIDSGMSYAQAIEIASDPQRALAFAAALEKGEDVLAQMVAEAQALEAATAKFSLAMKMAEFGDARKKQGFLGAVTALTSGNPLGGMVTDYLMGLNTSELQEFFNQTPEWRQEFVQAFLDSLPLAEKIKYLFDQISAQQKYQSTLNRDKANLAKGDIDNLDDQLKAQKKLLKAEQDKLKVSQRAIEAIQEENDDLDRGLELLSRQEEKINEAFDNRIEALDKVEQANARIAQQQQNQLNLSQALAEGDIYAATQAAQQIRQDNAVAAIENTREALELAREEQLKNLSVEVNGELLTREQIEKRIESNNDRIYQIQEDQVEVIEAAITAIQDQIESIEVLKDAWQDYFDFLEENSKITIEVDGKEIDFTFKELQDMASRFNEIMALDEIGGDANKAFDRLIADLAKAGKALTADELKALRQYFGITATAPTTPTPGTPAPGTSTGAGTEGEEETDITTDVNAAKEAAILALPEIQKVMDAAKNIKKAIAETPAKIVLFTKSLTKNAQPVIDTTKEKANGILKKFKAIGTNIVDELIPNALTPLKEFLEGGLLTAVDSVVDAFNKINSQITKAIGGVATLATSLANLERNIVINITVNTTYTSSGSSGGSTTKPKKFMGGLIKMATGGMIPGGIPRDSVPILASPGEFVVRNAMVDKYGMSMLNDINQGSFEPSFRTPSGTSYTKINKPTEMNASSTMYNNNYSINVTANTNADADQIASATVMKIRQMNSMQIRGARG